MYSLNLSNFILLHFVNMGYRCNSTWVHKFRPSFYTVNTVKLMNKLYEIPIHLLQFVYSSLIVLLCLEYEWDIMDSWTAWWTRLQLKWNSVWEGHLKQCQSMHDHSNRTEYMCTYCISLWRVHLDQMIQHWCV